MKTYRVGFSYTVYGHKYIKAKSPRQAEKILYEMLQNEGITGLKDYYYNDIVYHTEIIKTLKEIIK